MSKPKKPDDGAADAPEKPALTPVKWTQAGADKGAHSEHGTHKAGEIVETEHAAVLIERGFAEPA